MEYYVEKHYYQYTLQSAAKRKGFVPKENCEIFVKQLPADATVMEVAKFFESVDVLYEIRLMMHPNFNRNRGFCYVTYMNPQAASEALKLQQVPFRENQGKSNFIVCRNEKYKEAPIFKWGHSMPNNWISLKFRCVTVPTV